MARSIPHDAELKAHLDKQMDEHYGPTLFPFAPEDTFDGGPCAQEAIAENLIHAVVEGKLDGVDMVNLPPHYARLKIEPMRYAVENSFDIFQFSINKYLARWRFKGTPKQDLRKARRCLDMYIKWEDGDPNWWKVDSALLQA